MVNTTEDQVTDCYCDNCVMCRTLITQFYCTESLPVNSIPDRKADLSGDQLDIEDYIMSNEQRYHGQDALPEEQDALVEAEPTADDIDGDNADTEVTDRSMDDEEDDE